MTHASTGQPEALRLADALRDGQYSLYQERAATEAELRRLHARVQELERWQEDVRSNSPLLAELQRAKDRVHELEAQAARRAPAAPVPQVDAIGAALELESRAKLVESQTTERAMLHAANCLRLLAAAHHAAGLGYSVSIGEAPVLNGTLASQPPFQTEAGAVRQLEEIALLVRVLVRALRRVDPSNEHAVKALGYLKRHGLQGNPLRELPADGDRHS